MGLTHQDLLADHPLTPGDGIIIAGRDSGGLGAANSEDWLTYFTSDVVADVASLTSQVNAINAAGGLIGVQAPGTALSNSTTDTQLSNFAADATVDLAAGDVFAKMTFFTVVNTSGSSVDVTIKEKIAAANTFQWITLPYANLTGGVYLNWLYTEYTVGASSPNTDHHQFSWLQVAPIASGSVLGSGSSVTGTPASAMSIYPLGYLSAGTDYGLTQPQIEARFAFGTAATTISMQRIKSTLSFIKA